MVLDCLGNWIAPELHTLTFGQIRAQTHVGCVGGSSLGVWCGDNVIELALDHFHGCSMDCCIAVTLQSVASTCDLWPPRFIPVGMAINGTSHVCDLLVAGHIALVNKFNHVHAFGVATTLRQSCKLIGSCLHPSFFDDWIGMVDWVTTCHPASHFVVPNGAGIETAVDW